MTLLFSCSLCTISVIVSEDVLCSGHAGTTVSAYFYSCIACTSFSILWTILNHEWLVILFVYFLLPQRFWLCISWCYIHSALPMDNPLACNDNYTIILHDLRIYKSNSVVKGEGFTLHFLTVSKLVTLEFASVKEQWTKTSEAKHMILGKIEEQIPSKSSSQLSVNCQLTAKDNEGIK